MYQYTEFDQDFVLQRVAQFRDQVDRRIKGEISEEHFKPLRLQNGLYMQLHAYMLRVAIPYGVLNDQQLAKLGDLADRYDRGYGHFTTRQNLQYNWIRLDEVPDLLEELATVQMHAIQTSGNCIRNVTSDPLAGVAIDEVIDPRQVSELIRQWSSLHAEFLTLPRKFKIAVNGAKQDRTGLRVHDIGIQLKYSGDSQSIVAEIWVGGGQGRTPRIARLFKDDLPLDHLIGYLESILRIYNLYGRRDNKYKARIKILVDELGVDAMREKVEIDFNRRSPQLDQWAQKQLLQIQDAFPTPYLPPRDQDEGCAPSLSDDPQYQRWLKANLYPHRQSGYQNVFVSLKPIGGIPGDLTADQMRSVAKIARHFSGGEIRTTYDQNLILPSVAQADLFEVWTRLNHLQLATPNRGTITDLIACPGLDYCALATTRSIPIAQKISTHFNEWNQRWNLGPIELKISGCINACGHHHVGHIGILGVDKKGEEYYQILLGGRPDESCSLGKILGKSLTENEVIQALEKILKTYVQSRLSPQEYFIDAYSRLGRDLFINAVYGESTLRTEAVV